MSSFFASFEGQDLTPTQSTGKFGPLASDAYPGTIKVIYLTQGRNGSKAEFANIIFETDTGREFTDRLIVTTKDGATVDKNGEPLAGRKLLESLSIVATGNPLSFYKGQAPEVKTIKLYNYESRSEVPTQVQTLAPFTGTRAVFAITQKNEPKRMEVSPGNWVTSDETKIVSELRDVFHESYGLNSTEMRELNARIEGVDDPTAIIQEAVEKSTSLSDWVAQHKGKVYGRKSVEGMKTTGNGPSLFGARV